MPIVVSVDLMCSSGMEGGEGWPITTATECQALHKFLALHIYNKMNALVHYYSCLCMCVCVHMCGGGGYAQHIHYILLCLALQGQSTTVNEQTANTCGWLAILANIATIIFCIVFIIALAIGLAVGSPS